MGFGQLGRDTTLPVTPATQTPAPWLTVLPTASATADPLDAPGALPLVTDWVRALGLRNWAALTTLDAKSADWRNHECLTTIPQGQVLRQEVTIGGFQGGQTQFRVSSTQDPGHGRRGAGLRHRRVPARSSFTVTPTKGTGWPRLFSYTAGDAGSGWFAVVPGKHDLTLIQVVDPTHAKSVYTEKQVEALATIAEQRLARYGTGTSSGGSATTSTPAVGPTGSVRALSQDMPVSGATAGPYLGTVRGGVSVGLAGAQRRGRDRRRPGALEGSTAGRLLRDRRPAGQRRWPVGVVSVGGDRRDRLCRTPAGAAR